jgi:hypothetical protein
VSLHHHHHAGFHFDINYLHLKASTIPEDCNFETSIFILLILSFFYHNYLSRFLCHMRVRCEGFHFTLYHSQTKSKPCKNYTCFCRIENLRYLLLILLISLLSSEIDNFFLLYSRNSQLYS